MDLINTCNISMARELRASDLILISERVLSWHNYLKLQIRSNHLNMRVFTPNMHYLKHIPLTIEQMGPLRFLSWRSSERNIKTYSNAITSGSKAAANDSNIVLKKGVLASFCIREIVREDSHQSSYDFDRILDLPYDVTGDSKL
ncbi:hypothetical protein G6F56_013277 [Rhizopus delemar]|nr:hypothetical protein G6F56_013277 [Rhizopus delemar]